MAALILAAWLARNVTPAAHWGMLVELDHLVVGARTLQEGVDYVQEMLGVRPLPGGRHPGPGTHNALLSLGKRQYLEVISVDPEAASPAFPRWFALDDAVIRDQLSERPRLIAWVARTDDIDTAAGLLGLPLEIRPASRGDLSWRFAFTPDGALPYGGAVPHLIQWNTAAHPTDRLPDGGIRFVRLDVGHPDAGRVANLLQELHLNDRADRSIVVRPDASPTLRALLRTSSGECRLC